jgi:hypothetical protein
MRKLFSEVAGVRVCFGERSLVLSLQGDEGIGWGLWLCSGWGHYLCKAVVLYDFILLGVLLYFASCSHLSQRVLTSSG